MITIKRVLMLGLAAALALGTIALPSAQAQDPQHNDAGSGRDAGPDHRTAVPIELSTDEYHGFILQPESAGHTKIMGNRIDWPGLKSRDYDWYEFEVEAGDDVYVTWDGPFECIQINTPSGNYVAYQTCAGHYAFTAEVSGSFRLVYGLIGNGPGVEDVFGAYTFTVSDTPLDGVDDPSEYERYGDGGDSVYLVGESDDAGSGRDSTPGVPVAIEIGDVITGVFTSSTGVGADDDLYSISEQIDAGRRIVLEVLEGPSDMCIDLQYLLRNRLGRVSGWDDTGGCPSGVSPALVWGTNRTPFGSGIAPERTTYELLFHSDTALPGTEYKFIVRVDDEPGPLTHNLPSS